MVDIDLIDAGGVNRCDRPRNRVLPNAFCKHLAPICRKQLRVAQATNSVAGIKYYRSRYYWSE